MNNWLMKHDLTRFLLAQRDVYAVALSEIRAGKKRSHWMWFIFPQLKGLGLSSNAMYFGGIPDPKTIALLG